MGFAKKIAEKLGVKKVDHRAEITGLEPDLTVLTVVLAAPAAAERSGSSGGGLQGRLASQIGAAATNAVTAGRHLGGPEGGLAYAFPRDLEFLVIALTDRGLSAWDFGMMGVSTTPPTKVFESPRETVASIENRGKKKMGGTMTRLTFTDESYVDVELVKPTEEFWETAGTW